MNILWFIEHVSRELDVACCVKTIIESKSSVRVHIKHLLLDLEDLLKSPDQTDIMVFPFFYNCNFNAIRKYLSKWKNSKVFNLSWEELYYTAHSVIKAPGDDFTKQFVIHHAWGDFFKDYLIKNDVLKKNVFVNGQPAYKLYESPYSDYFKSRLELSKEFGLSMTKRWVFIPENYKWAFLSDSRLKEAIKDGADADDLVVMKKFCQESLAQLISWCAEAVVSLENIELIFRPRPAVNSEIIKQLINAQIGKMPPRFNVIKDESVREWILASDIVISSYSTSLIEASIAHKNIYMALPLPLPRTLWCSWYDKIERLNSNTEFIAACRGIRDCNYTRMETWARENMLSCGDPLVNLADYFITMAEDSFAASKYQPFFSTTSRHAANQRKNDFIYRLYSSIKLYVLTMETADADSGSRVKNALFKAYRMLVINLFNLRLPIIWVKAIFDKKGGYNRYIYEKDAFSNDDISRRCEKWRNILFPN